MLENMESQGDARRVVHVFSSLEMCKFSCGKLDMASITSVFFFSFFFCCEVVNLLDLPFCVDYCLVVYKPPRPSLHISPRQSTSLHKIHKVECFVEPADSLLHIHIYLAFAKCFSEAKHMDSAFIVRSIVKPIFAPKTKCCSRKSPRTCTQKKPDSVLLPLLVQLC